MKEKIKKFSKQYLIGFVIGIVVCGGVSVIAATYFPSNQVTYENGTSGMQATDVQGAIDELYSTCFPSFTMGGQPIDVVTSGDGLYQDEYESGRLIYRGINPDNYMYFNCTDVTNQNNSTCELWRIVAKEVDGTYKIIKNDYSSWIDFDMNDHRSNANNTFCNGIEFGCSVYAAVDGVFSLPDGSRSGTVTEDSSIKIYLNEDYYVNDLNDTAKMKMTSHSFNIGAVEYLSDVSSDSIEKNVAEEKKYQWTGNVGLVNVSDVLKASINPLCTPVDYFMSCNNYLFFRSSRYWTINPISAENLWVVLSEYNYISISNESAAYDGSSASARPVVFLKSNIKFKGGNGSSSNPYQLEY